MKLSVLDNELVEENLRTIDSLGWAIVNFVEGNVEDKDAVVDVAILIARLAKEAKEKIEPFWGGYREALDKVKMLQEELDHIKKNKGE